MSSSGNTAFARRGLLMAGMGLSMALVLPACATAGAGGASQPDPLRRLMTLATQNAFAKLTAPDGFWTSPVARIELPVLFNKNTGALAQPDFRESLKHKLNTFAEVGARAAASPVADAIRAIPGAQSRALLRGEPTAGTSYLRQQMGPAVVNAMIPALEAAIRTAGDPVVTQATALLSGVTLMDVAHALALAADNALWYQVGMAEGDIRTNPAATNDPGLIRALRRR